MTYPTVDFFMVWTFLVPSSTENLNLFSIGFSAEFDFPCLYSNTCIVHLCSCRLFSYNILPISFCSNAPPHFCATVIRSLCLHSSYDIASCLYIYTQEYKLMQTELQVRHGGWEVHCLYRDHWMSVTGAIHKKDPTWWWWMWNVLHLLRCSDCEPPTLGSYQWTFVKDRRNHVFLPYTSCAHSVHSWC